MKKTLSKIIALTTGMLCFTCAPAVFAANDADIEILQKQVEELISYNQQLSKRIVDLEKTRTGLTSGEHNGELPHSIPTSLLHTHVHSTIQKAMRKQQEEEGTEQKINDYVTLFGVLEGEAVFGEDYEGTPFSEFNIATVELGMAAQVSDFAAAQLVALYEGPDGDLNIDEATILFSNPEKTPFSLNIGQFYMPFGAFESNMIQSPLTLDIGEIGEHGIALNFASKGFYGGVYGYNGMKETGSDETITGFGADAGYELETDTMNLRTGISWVNNIADAGGISDYLADSGIDTVQEHINGIGLHIMAGFGPVTFIGEYIQALDEFTEVSELDPENPNAQVAYSAEPAAWNTEIAYSTELFDNESIFAIGYQGTNEAVELGLPETRFLVAASMVLLPGTALSMEYSFDTDYNTNDGGTGDDASVFITQLAYEF